MWCEESVRFTPRECLAESVADEGIALHAARHAQRKHQALSGTCSAALGRRFTTGWKFALLQRPLPRVEVGGVPATRDAIERVCTRSNGGNAGALPVEGVVP